MRIAILVIPAWLAAVSAAEHRSASVSVQLRERATADGEQVLLSDIADIAGPDARVESLGALPVGRSPLPGKERAFDLEDVRTVLRLQGEDAADVAVVGAAVTRVRAGIRIVEGDELVEAAASAVRERFADREDFKVAVECVSAPAPLAVRPGPVVLKPEVPSMEWTSGPHTLRVSVMRNNRSIGEAFAGLKIRFQARVPVAARRIEDGQTMGAGDFKFEWRDAVSSARQPADTAHMLGRVAKSAIPAGRVLEEKLFEAPLAVHRGDRVTVRVTRGALTITANGEARADARPGETIGVKLADSGAEVRARVTGPGEAEL